MIKLSLAKLAHRTVEHSTVLDGKRYAFEVLFEIKYTAKLASITGSNSPLDSCFYCRHALLPPEERCVTTKIGFTELFKSVIFCRFCRGYKNDKRYT